MTAMRPMDSLLYSSHHDATSAAAAMRGPHTSHHLVRGRHWQARPELSLVLPAWHWLCPQDAWAPLVLLGLRAGKLVG